MRPSAATAERVPVLMYHCVGEPVDARHRNYCVRPDDFARHMRAVSDAGYCAVSLDRFIAWLEGRGTLPAGAFLLTFDDGFRGIKEHAVPLLHELAWPCTVFLVSGMIGGCDRWSGGTGTTSLLSSAEILAMAADGVRFESHTRHHARLPDLSDESLADELAGAKSDLEALLCRPVRYLAYPFGEFDERTVAAARNVGYAAAFSTQPGFNRPHADRYRIRRLDVFGTDSAAQVLRKLKLGSNDGSVQAMAGYYGRRMARALWR